ncbi:MAG: glucokinase, partial [Pseudomonadota bacterium]
MAHAPARLLAVDVGGTNTRVVICEPDGRRIIERRAVLATKHDLRAQIHGAVAEAGGWNRIGHTVIDFAGPVRRPDVAQMTNWPDSPEIDADELRAWLHGSDRFTMLNDMEAAALGVISAPAAASETLHAGEPAADGGRLIVAPGTGLGSIGVVAGTALDARVLNGLLPSEVGHARAAPGSDQLTEALHAWRDDHGYWPGWEELVSGRGLEGLYAIAAGRVADAAWIARHGDRRHEDADNDAVTALEL